MKEFVVTLSVVVLIMCCGSQVKSNASDHQYKHGDPVPLYVNKVGPYNNPSETYRYFDLPFCVPDNVKEKRESLNAVLNGDRLVIAPYKLDFLVEKNSEVVCIKKLTKEEVSKFRTAVAKDYYFQMYYDDLPIWGFLGRVDMNEDKYFLFQHINFNIYYKKDNVIEVDTQGGPRNEVELTDNEEVFVKFVYTVNWNETNTQFEERVDKYAQQYYSMQHHWEIPIKKDIKHDLAIHWFSIGNSCWTVLLLIGCLSTYYMRVLKKDFTESSHDEESTDNLEETGWKHIHGDVFRYPNHKSLFVAALGSGTQLFTLTVLILILGVVDAFYPYKRGDLLTTLVAVYLVTSGIAGYTAASFYCQLEGMHWVRNLLLTGCLFSGPLLLAFCFLNTVSIVHKVTAALPFGTIAIIVLTKAMTHQQ